MDGDLHTISVPPFGRLEADLMQTAYFLERLGYLRLDAETSRATLYISLQKQAGSRHTTRASELPACQGELSPLVQSKSA